MDRKIYGHKKILQNFQNGLNSLRSVNFQSKLTLKWDEIKIISFEQRNTTDIGNQSKFLHLYYGGQFWDWGGNWCTCKKPRTFCKDIYKLSHERYA